MPGIYVHRAVKARLGRLNRGAWRLYRGLGRRLARDNPAMLRIMDAVQWQADHFEEIPVIVIACLRGVIPPLPRIAAASLYGSIFPSVQNLLLAARAAGLGAALITLPLWSTFLARRALGLPWRVTPCGAWYRTAHESEHPASLVRQPDPSLRSG